MKKKMVVLIFIVLVLIILNILFLSKFYKVNKIVNLIKVNNLNENYFLTIIMSDSRLLTVNRNGNIIFKNLKASNYQFLEYYNFNNNYLYDVIIKSKKYNVRKIENYDYDIKKFPLYEYLTNDYSFINKLKLVFEWKIRDCENNKYEITTKDNYKVIFNKNTGLAESVTNASEKKRVYYILEDYQENCVTDEDVKLPDLSEYTKVDNIEELGN